MKKLFLALLFLFSPAVVRSQVFDTPPTCPSGTQPSRTTRNPQTGNLRVVECIDGSGNVVQAVMYFTTFMGFSPKDFGAKGDWQVDATCTANNASSTVTCNPGRFVQSDSGKLFELNAIGSSGFPTTINTGKITYVSQSTVLLSSPATFSQAGNAIIKWGTDDTLAIDAWVASINAAGTVHSGYVPRGVFYTRHGLRFIAPVNSDCNNFYNGGTFLPSLPCAVIISGQGNTVSQFMVPSAGTALPFDWASAGATANNGVLYVNGWASWQMTNFSIIADGSAQNSSATSGITGGEVIDSSNHGYQVNVLVTGFHNAATTLPGYVSTSGGGSPATGISAGAFESYIQPYFEKNDINAWICSGVSVCEKETYANGFLEAGMRANLDIGSNSGTTTLKQLRIDNVHMDCSSPTGFSSVDCLRFNTASTASTKDPVVITNSRISNSSGTAPTGQIIEVFGTGGLAIDFASDFVELIGAGSQALMSIASGANATIRLNGGAWSNSNACASACIINNADAGSFVFIGNTGIFPLNSTDAFMFGGAGVNNIATLHDITSPFAGNGGRGALSATAYLTFQNCNPGSVVSPAACGSASSGTVVVPTTTTTYTVNTTTVTSSSRIIIIPITDNSGLTGSPTCNAPPTPFIAYESGRVAGISFSFTLPSTAGTSCWTFEIKN